MERRRKERGGVLDDQWVNQAIHGSEGGGLEPAAPSFMPTLKSWVERYVFF